MHLNAPASSLNARCPVPSSARPASAVDLQYSIYPRPIGWSFGLGYEYPRRSQWRPTKSWAKRAANRRTVRRGTVARRTAAAG